MDYNRGAAAWVVFAKDIEGYEWVSLPTTLQVLNAYRSELASLYVILALLLSVLQLYQLHKGEL